MSAFEGLRPRSRRRGINYAQAGSLKTAYSAAWRFTRHLLACRPRISRLERHVGRRGAFAPFWASPHDAWILFQGAQLFVAIGPFRRGADCAVIERLATGAAVEQGARNVHHLR